MREIKVDIKENEILNSDPKLLEILLKDNSSGKNIIWSPKCSHLINSNPAHSPLNLSGNCRRMRGRGRNGDNLEVR